MNELPLFSVLIANYNNGSYLQEAIDSVLAQTYTNWEVVIVDDGSTDNSSSIYDKYQQDSRFHIYYNEQNKGCGFAKRRCVELSKGALCGFLDPDDALTPNALEVMVSVHREYPNVSLAYSQSNIVDDEMRFIKLCDIQRDIPDGSSFLELGDGISHFVVFKKDKYNQTPGIDPYYLRAVDHELFYLMEEVGDLKFVKETLYCYRTQTTHNISLGNNAYKAFIWHLVGGVDACRRRGLSSKQTEDLMSQHLVHFLNDYAVYKETRIRTSIAYRLGNCVVRPLKKISRFFK